MYFSKIQFIFQNIIYTGAKTPGPWVSGAIWGGSRVAMATPDQAVATPEFIGPIRRGGQEFIGKTEF